MSAGGSQYRRVAETGRVPDERTSELGQELVGRSFPVGEDHRAGVGDHRQHVLRVDAVHLEDAVRRQSRLDEHAPPRGVSVSVADRLLDAFQEDSVHQHGINGVPFQQSAPFVPSWLSDTRLTLACSETRRSLGCECDVGEKIQQLS